MGNLSDLALQGHDPHLVEDHAAVAGKGAITPSAKLFPSAVN